MLRDNLAGLIEPMLNSAAAHNLGGHLKRDKLGDAAGRPIWRSSLLSDPSAKFFARKPSDRQKRRHDSRAARTAQHKGHRTIDPQCLENPRPAGAESTLTGNAASPFPAEPRQYLLRQACAFLVGERDIEPRSGNPQRKLLEVFSCLWLPWYDIPFIFAHTRKVSDSDRSRLNFSK